LVEAALERFGRINPDQQRVSPFRRRNVRIGDKSLSVDSWETVRLVDAVLPGCGSSGQFNLFIIIGIGVGVPDERFGYTSAKYALNTYAKKLCIVEG
jgi:hypothetical protein